MGDLDDLEKRVSSLFAGLGGGPEEKLRLRSRSRGQEHNKDKVKLVAAATLRPRSQKRNRSRERSRDRNRRSKSRRRDRDPRIEIDRGRDRDRERSRRSRSRGDAGRHRRRRSRSRDVDRGRSDPHLSSAPPKSDHSSHRSEPARSSDRPAHGSNTSSGRSTDLRTNRNPSPPPGRFSENLPQASSRNDRPSDLKATLSVRPPSPTRPPGHFDESLSSRNVPAKPLASAAVPKSKSAPSSAAPSASISQKPKPSSGLGPTVSPLREGHMASTPSTTQRPKPSSAKPSSAPPPTRSTEEVPTFPPEPSWSLPVDTSFPPRPPIPKAPTTSLRHMDEGADADMHSAEATPVVSDGMGRFPLLRALAKQKPASKLIGTLGKPLSMKSTSSTNLLGGDAHHSQNGPQSGENLQGATDAPTDVAPWRLDSSAAAGGDKPGKKLDWLDRLRAMRGKGAAPAAAPAAAPVPRRPTSAEARTNTSGASGATPSRPVFRGPSAAKAAPKVPPKASKPPLVLSRLGSVGKAQPSVAKGKSLLAPQRPSVAGSVGHSLARKAEVAKAKSPSSAFTPSTLKMQNAIASANEQSKPTKKKEPLPQEKDISAKQEETTQKKEETMETKEPPKPKEDTYEVGDIWKLLL